MGNPLGYPMGDPMGYPIEQDFFPARRVIRKLGKSSGLGPATIGKTDHQFSRFKDVLTMKLLVNHYFLIKESIEASAGASNVPDSFDESRE